MYDPANYLRRCFEQCLRIGSLTGRRQTMKVSPSRGLRIFAQLTWHQGIRQPEIRAQFWVQFWKVLARKPQVLTMYLGLCASGEHFWEYRVLAKDRIAQQLGYDPIAVAIMSPPESLIV
jgi:Domain of unknown function (DUF4070)